MPLNVPPPVHDSCPERSSLVRNYALGNGIPCKFRGSAEPELVHDAISMELDRLRGNVQDRGDFFGGLSFSDQLYYLALAWCKPCAEERCGIHFRASGLHVRLFR